jgi:hypothetical protein
MRYRLPGRTGLYVDVARQGEGRSKPSVQP